MIRIKPFKCGYGGAKGYTCDGIPSLTSGHMFDKNQVVRTTGGIDVTVADLDWEFNQLPTRVKGMVYTEDTMDMSWDGPEHPEVAELTCRENTDPFSDATTDISVHPDYLLTNYNGSVYNYPVFGGTSAWSDLFNSGYMLSGSTHYFYQAYPNLDPDTSHDIPYVNENHDVYLYVTEDPTHKHYKIANTSHIPSFKQITPEGIVELEMGPGLLEPMLDTDFDPIHIDQIPAWEAGDDSQIVFNQLINTWKGVVDDRFRNIYWRLNNLPTPSGIDENLLDLIDDQYSSTDCTNFRITLSEGQSLQRVGETPVTNTYAVSAGDIYINNEYIHVAGISVVDSPVPFRVWLHVYKLSEPDPTTGNTWGAILSHSSAVSSDPGNYAIGGVEVVQASDQTGAYILYKVFQEDCLSNIVVDEEDELPYAVRGVITLDEEDAEGIDDIVTESENMSSDEDPDYEEGEVLPNGHTISNITHTTEDEQDVWTWTETWYKTHTAGIVQPVCNILEGADPKPQSTQDVPTVKAVIEYIHGASVEGYSIADARATGGTMSQTLEVTGGTPGTVDVVNNIETTVISGRTTTATGYVPTAQAVVDYVIKNKVAPASSSISGMLTITAGTVTVEIDGQSTVVDTYDESWTITDPATPVRGTVEVSDVILVGETNSRVLSRQAVPSVNAVYDFIHSTAINGESASQTGYVQALNTRGTITPAASSGTGMYSESWDGEPGTVRVAKNIWMNTYHTYSVSAVPTVEAVYKFIHGMTASNEPMLTAMATPGTIVEDDDWGYSAGTMGVVFVASSVTYPPAYDSSVSYCVPSVQAMIDYVGASLPYTHASLGYVQVPNTTTEVIGNATWGTLRIVQNIDIAPSHVSINPAEYETETAAPSVAAVFRFIHARYNATTQVSTALASAATITGTTTGSDPTETGIELTGGTPGTFEVSLNIKEHPASHTSLDTCVPTANAVVEYVYSLGIGHSDSGNIEIGAVTISGVVYSYGERWGQSGDKAQRGTVEVSDRILVATDSNLRVLSHEAVPSVWAVYDFVHSTHTASDDPNGGTRQALAYPDAIRIGTADAEVFAGTPGTVYLANNLKVSSDSGKRLYSAKAVPTVKSVYEFVHGGSATSIMSSPLAEPTAMTASTTQPTLTAVPGTMYVADSIEVDSTGSTTAPNCVPTAQAVVTYVATHGGTGSAVPAVRGALSIDDGTEVIVDESASVIHVQGIVNVLNTVKYAKEATRAITPDAVPSVVAVYDFLHNEHLNANDSDYLVQALANGAAMNKSGTSVTPGTGMAGTVRLATDIKIGSGTTTVPDSYRVVPTAQAVVNWVAEHGGSSPIAIANSGTAGLVYVTNSITSYQPWIQTVPTVDAVYNAIQGTTASGGGVPWPNYPSLTNYSATGSLSLGQDYVADNDGWLVVSNFSTSSSDSNCGYVIINGGTIGIGNNSNPTGKTCMFPVKRGWHFCVGLSTGRAFFDAGATPASRSNNTAGSVMRSNAMKLNGVEKYDPEESVEEEEDILMKYADTSTFGSEADLAEIIRIRNDAEDSKNEIAGICNTIVQQERTAATDSYRADLCNDYIVEVCGSASALYTTASNDANVSTAREALEEGDHYASIASSWVSSAYSYLDDIERVQREAENADYTERVDELVEHTDDCVTAAVAENERLEILGLNGGAEYVDLTRRANTEAYDWRSRVEEELENSALVYTSAYNKTSKTCEEASAVYEALMSQAQEAYVYVNGLEKPQQR